MKVIPMHSLVLIMGSQQNVRASQLEMFPRHEVLRPTTIRNELIGDNKRHNVDEVVSQELHRRMVAKLRLGERVVVDAQGLDKASRMPLANAGRSMGVPVIYLIAGEADRDASRGDGVAEVFDARVEARPVVAPTEVDLRKRFRGVTAIGDVHGMYQSLLNALAWARSRQHFVILMGDVLDYGPNTLEVADEVYRLVMRGEGAMILGNHERKIMRWIDGQKVRLSDGNRVTTTALNSLGESNRTKWIGRFRGLFQHGTLVRRISNVTFAHAGVYPGFWKGEPMTRDAENMAYFGETDEARSVPDRRVPAYSWAEQVPADQIAVVGHDRRAANPFVQKNSLGGRTVFLDTGSGKGGTLSSADFRFTETGMRLENFNIY